MQRIQFAYFKGMEAEQYSFYRVPKVLFTESCFQSLSCEAKILYGLMLDRMGLSVKNRWLDDLGRVYIIFRVEEVMELLGCGRQKAVKSIAELDREKGIGLIEKRRIGLGRPNVIYVKHILFAESEGQDDPKTGEESDTDFQEYENQTSERVNNELPKVLAYERGEIATSENTKGELPEVSKSYFRRFENHTGSGMKNGSQKVRKSYGNKTDFSKTDWNETGSIPSILSEEDKWKSGKSRMDKMGKMSLYRQEIRENIGYDQFTETGYDRQVIDELVELMAEVMGMPDSARVRISGVDKPAGEVKSRMMELDHSHMDYVLLCLRQNRTKVGNIRAYLLTALYNAPLPISNYYQAEANHDLHEGEMAAKI